VGVGVTARFSTWIGLSRVRLALPTVLLNAGGENVRSDTESESMTECRHLKATADLFETASVHQDGYSGVLPRHGRNGGTSLDFFTS